MTRPVCSVPDCDSPNVARTYCRKHYLRWYSYGDPLATKYERHDGPPEERWRQKVQEAPSGCWLWTGSLDRRGYGQFTVNYADGSRRTLRAHRFVYELLIGQLPAELTLDHLCRVRHCVNPDHLDPVLHRDNVRRGEAGVNNASKTHCSRGHEFTPENTHWDGRQRNCRTCRREWGRESYARRKAGTASVLPANADKTHCKHGHEFTPENTIRTAQGRACRECQRRSARECMRRKREAARASRS